MFCATPWSMKSNADVRFGEIEDGSELMLTRRSYCRYPVAVETPSQPKLERASLIREARARRRNDCHGKFVADAGEADCLGSNPAAGNRQSQGRLANGAATAPPRSSECDSLRTHGFGRLFAGLQGNLGQGSLGVPHVRMEAIRREPSTNGKRRRYSLAGAALRAHLRWAVAELRQLTSPGPRVLTTAYRAGTASCCPCPAGR